MRTSVGVLRKVSLCIYRMPSHEENAYVYWNVPCKGDLEYGTPLRLEASDGFRKTVICNGQRLHVRSVDVSFCRPVAHVGRLVHHVSSKLYDTRWIAHGTPLRIVRLEEEKEDEKVFLCARVKEPEDTFYVAVSNLDVCLSAQSMPICRREGRRFLPLETARWGALSTDELKYDDKVMILGPAVPVQRKGSDATITTLLDILVEVVLLPPDGEEIGAGAGRILCPHDLLVPESSRGFARSPPTPSVAYYSSLTERVWPLVHGMTVHVVMEEEDGSKWVIPWSGDVCTSELNLSCTIPVKLRPNQLLSRPPLLTGRFRSGDLVRDVEREGEPFVIIGAKSGGRTVLVAPYDDAKPNGNANLTKASYVCVQRLMRKQVRLPTARDKHEPSREDVQPPDPGANDKKRKTRRGGKHKKKEKGDGTSLPPRTSEGASSVLEEEGDESSNPAPGVVDMDALSDLVSELQTDQVVQKEEQEADAEFQAAPFANLVSNEDASTTQMPHEERAARSECIVCFEECTTIHAFVPCGHATCCPTCVSAVLASEESLCPTCRSFCLGSLRVFV